MTLPCVSQEKTVSQIASVQDMTVEFQTENQRVVALSSINELGFIERGTGKHQSNIVYGSDGICPCEYSVQYKEPFKILE